MTWSSQIASTQLVSQLGRQVVNEGFSLSFEDELFAQGCGRKPFTLFVTGISLSKLVLGMPTTKEPKIWCLWGIQSKWASSTKVNYYASTLYDITLIEIF